MGKNMFKSKIKALVLVVALVGCVVPAMAQRTFHAYRPHAEQKDSVKTLKWEPHLSVSTGFIGSNYGDNRLFTSVAPSLDFRPNDRWRLTGGFLMWLVAMPLSTVLVGATHGMCRPLPSLLQRHSGLMIMIFSGFHSLW